MNIQEFLQYSMAVLGGGAGLKIIDSVFSYFKDRKQRSIEYSKIKAEQQVDLAKIELESEDRLRVELWDRIKGLESRMSELDRKEQDCWDKYNMLFKSNAELASELNYVKTVLHASSSEVVKLLPKKDEIKK